MAATDIWARIPDWMSARHYSSRLLFQPGAPNYLVAVSGFKTSAYGGYPVVYKYTDVPDSHWYYDGIHIEELVPFGPNFLLHRPDVGLGACLDANENLWIAVPVTLVDATLTPLEHYVRCYFYLWDAAELWWPPEVEFVFNTPALSVAQGLPGDPVLFPATSGNIHLCWRQKDLSGNYQFRTTCIVRAQAGEQYTAPPTSGQPYANAHAQFAEAPAGTIHHIWWRNDAEDDGDFVHRSAADAPSPSWGPESEFHHPHLTNLPTKGYQWDCKGLGSAVHLVYSDALDEPTNLNPSIIEYRDAIS